MKCSVALLCLRQASLAVLFTCSQQANRWGGGGRRNIPANNFTMWRSSVTMVWATQTQAFAYLAEEHDSKGRALRFLRAGIRRAEPPALRYTRATASW